MTRRTLPPTWRAALVVIIITVLIAIVWGAAHQPSPRGDRSRGGSFAQCGVPTRTGGIVFPAEPCADIIIDVQLPMPLPLCPTEDSTDCFWDASEQGNGVGHDVINEGDPAHD